ncbi:MULTISPECIES: cupredoxin domain-containing protein [unclassified Lactobacillus]|uniref:cupredoxin domain-containing protein n=1 Tax=unclassified Lactobacillus TaxID=2620435 RepID=UPI00351C5A68
MVIRIIILCLGVALIVFIAWWFFGKHNVATENASVNSNKQSVDIVVKGGYSPEKVILERGIPATLNFKRTDSSSCLDHVIFSDFGINQKLPQGKTEPIKIDTSKPGEYEWACSMNMFHGKVIVK